MSAKFILYIEIHSWVQHSTINIQLTADRGLQHPIAVSTKGLKGLSILANDVLPERCDQHWSTAKAIIYEQCDLLVKNIKICIKLFCFDLTGLSGSTMYVNV